MRTYDIIVAVHHAIKAPSRDTYGPESVGLYGTAAGVSLLSTRPEGPNLAGLLPEGWGIYNELRSEEPWRKIVKIVLPEDVEGGDYLLANVTINGLHSTRYSAKDGMGSTVYVLTKEARLMDIKESNNDAIDRAIRSGIVLLVPGADGKRHETPVEVAAVSELYGGSAPADWIWDK